MRVLLIRRCVAMTCAAAAISLFTVAGIAQDSGTLLQSHLDAGEFPAALKIAGNMPAPEANQWLGKISRQQFDNGARQGAFNTAGMIADDRLRAGTLSGLFSNTSYDQFPGNGAAGGNRFAGNGNRNPGGQGGVTIQDFQPLIDLIKSTVAPDDWDDSNGDGTIQPYVAGVYVDPLGTLRKIKSVDSSKLDKLRERSIDDSGNRQSAFDSPLRKVSITRLEKAAQMRAAQGQPLTEDMEYLAGIYEISYLMVYPDSGDIVIAGPAGPWAEDAEGIRINKKTGKPVLQLDDLVVCLRNAWGNNAKFGCTISPRQKNLMATKEFLANSKLKGKAWRDELRETLGQQDVRVFGIDPRTHAGRAIVEADYRMKLIGMGLEPSIPEVPSYLSRVKPAAGGVPMDVVRWWFTLNYDDVVADASRQVFAFTGPGVKVLSENELLDDEGKRIHTGKSDPLTAGFARDFTEHFNEMADVYPVYRQLKNVFDLSLVAAVVRDQGISQDVEWNLTYFGDSDDYDLVYQPRLSHAPKQVDSVMNHRTVSVRKESSTVRHTIIGVSGGVAFDAMQIARADRIRTDQDGQLEKDAEESRPRADHWWWD